MKLTKLLAALVVSACSSIVTASPQVQATNQASAIVRAAEEHAAKVASRVLPPDTEIKASVTSFDHRLRFPDCKELVAESARGASPWGKTVVEISCASPHWRVHVPVTVSAKVTYLAAAAHLPAGHLVGKDDLVRASGDISRLPRDTVLADTTIEGRRLATVTPSGQPLRLSYFSRENAVTAGQKVKLTISGNGFTITAIGTSTSSAEDGELVRVVGPNGKPLDGRAKTGGTVEVALQ